MYYEEANNICGISTDNLTTDLERESIDAITNSSNVGGTVGSTREFIKGSGTSGIDGPDTSVVMILLFEVVIDDVLDGAFSDRTIATISSTTGTISSAAATIVGHFIILKKFF